MSIRTNIAALFLAVVTITVAGCGLVSQPSRDEAVIRLDEAQQLMEEVLTLAGLEADFRWESEFLLDDNACKITCRDCGQANRRLELVVAESEASLERSLRDATESLNGRFRPANSADDKDFYSIWLKGPSGQEYLNSLALSPDAIDIQLNFVCYR